jgi:hypothetical protein
MDDTVEFAHSLLASFSVILVAEVGDNTFFPASNNVKEALAGECVLGRDARQRTRDTLVGASRQHHMLPSVARALR